MGITKVDLVFALCYNQISNKLSPLFKMKMLEIKEKLNVDTISKKGNTYTIRKGFFYRFGNSAQTFVERIKKEFPNAQIIDEGEHWTSFKGGASIANQSHWFVKFIL